MENNIKGLSDSEVLGLIELLNKSLDFFFSENYVPGILPLTRDLIDEELVLLTYQKSKCVTELRPLLRKLLREAVERKLIEIPPCFKGSL